MSKTIFRKNCDTLTYSLKDINRTFGESILSSIHKGPKEDNQNGGWIYGHEWCSDLYCELKDKCERSKQNINHLLRFDESVEENSVHYFTLILDFINKTTDIASLKLIESESKKCGDFRSMFEEICKTTNYFYHNSPKTLIDSISTFGDSSHAYQVFMFYKLANESRMKINVLKSQKKILISPPRAKPRVGTTRKPNERRKKSSVYSKLVAKETKRRDNKKRK